MRNAAVKFIIYGFTFDGIQRGKSSFINSKRSSKARVRASKRRFVYHQKVLREYNPRIHAVQPESALRHLSGCMGINSYIVVMLKFGLLLCLLNLDD